MGATVFFIAYDDDRGLELWKTDGTDAGTKLVKDINQSQGLFNDSNPSHLTNVAGTLFFAADDGIHGQELWSSDGTAPGTQLVRDLNPGEESSFPQYLANVGGTLFLQAATPLEAPSCGRPSRDPSPGPSSAPRLWRSRRWPFWRSRQCGRRRPMPRPRPWSRTSTRARRSALAAAAVP